MKEVQGWGEAIQYGFADAREIVIFLLVDDGVPDRGHRKVLLDPGYHYVGVGVGAHAKFEKMCVLDFGR